MCTLQLLIHNNNLPYSDPPAHTVKYICIGATCLELTMTLFAFHIDDVFTISYRCISPYACRKHIINISWSECKVSVTFV